MRKLVLAAIAGTVVLLLASCGNKTTQDKVNHKVENAKESVDHAMNTGCMVDLPVYREFLLFLLLLFASHQQIQRRCQRKCTRGEKEYQGELRQNQKGYKRKTRLISPDYQSKRGKKT